MDGQPVTELLSELSEGRPEAIQGIDPLIHDALKVPTSREQGR